MTERLPNGSPGFDEFEPMAYVMGAPSAWAVEVWEGPNGAHGIRVSIGSTNGGWRFLLDPDTADTTGDGLKSAAKVVRSKLLVPQNPGLIKPPGY